ncbi:MAG: OmpA family protein [Terriglobales bacterium]|jgi:outer membrane protein OmpA-like peptidoglycan-associated protein
MLSLAAVGLTLFIFCVERAQAQTPIQKSAAKACAVMSGQSKPDGQALQLLTMLQQGGLDPTDSIAFLLTREVLKQCPKDYSNYQQRMRANNPFPPGSLVQQNPVDLTPGLTKQGAVNLTPGSGAALTKSSAELYKPGKALTVALTVKETSKETRLALSADVLFDFDKAIIRPDGAEALQRVTSLIRDKNHGIVRIEGYTDSKGAEDHNKRLSEQRAQAVKSWLVKNGGFSVSTFSTRGLGASDPVARNTKPDGTDDPAGRQRNRRVELVIAK